MPLAQTIVSGVLYSVEGDPVVGASVYVHKAIKAGTSLLYKSNPQRVASSNDDGEIQFTAPRDSIVWLSGRFYVGSTSFEESSGVAVAIPDSGTATLEDLVAGAVNSTPDVRTILATSTVLPADDVIFADVSAGAFALNLMPADDRMRVLFIKVIGTGDNLLTVTPDGVETINGLASLDLYSGDSIRLIPRTSAAWETI